MLHMTLRALLWLYLQSYSVLDLIIHVVYNPKCIVGYRKEGSIMNILSGNQRIDIQ